jgi:galactokinase
VSGVSAVRAGFAEVFGGAPAGVWAAPGRVNLIGEHTDYNDGFVLPIALAQRVLAAARPRSDGRLRLHSAQGDGQTTDLTVANLRAGAVATWAAYPAGVVWALREAGHDVGGADVYLAGDVPTGAGLSSSAALECAVAFAYDGMYGLGLTAPRLALLAQRAENDFVGVPCGVMDQMASACCKAGSALFLDTRDLSVRHVPFDAAAHGLRLLVVDTRVKHDLGDGAYAALRAGCERAAELAGRRALRDVALPELDTVLGVLPPELHGLVRHVVTEQARVTETLALLDADRVAEVGPVLTAGHASLRDDFRVSCPETDLVVETAVAAGALGARMTGGGFGGSVIVLTRAEAADGVTAAVEDAFAAAGYARPRVFAAEAGGGAGRVE